MILKVRGPTEIELRQNLHDFKEMHHFCLKSVSIRAYHLGKLIRLYVV